MSARRSSSLTSNERPSRSTSSIHSDRRRASIRSRSTTSASRSERGEFFGIIGPNGSGKSTLLKVLAGIYPHDTGLVRVDGRLSPFIELGVGFNAELTARDNVRINGTLLGLTRRQVGERFDDIIAFAGLERFVDQKLKNFSSGMHVQAGVLDRDPGRLRHPAARRGARRRRPGVPGTVLRDARRDPGGRQDDRFRLARSGAIGSHCDRVMLLIDGGIEAIGEPGHALDRYDAIMHPVADRVS